MDREGYGRTLSPVWVEPQLLETGSQEVGIPVKKTEKAGVAEKAAGAVANATDDPVNPGYYKTGGIETIDFIEAKGLDSDFCLASVIKYVSRCGKKAEETALTDLKKAAWYLGRAIRQREGNAPERKVCT